MSKVKVQSLVPANPQYLGWIHFSDANDGKNIFCLLCAADGKEQLYKVGFILMLLMSVMTKYEQKLTNHKCFVTLVC